MFIFRKIWPALFSCYLRFDIRLFALLPTNYRLSLTCSFFCVLVLRSTYLPTAKIIALEIIEI